MASEKEKNPDVAVVDAESLKASDHTAGQHKLVRQLKNRHVAMIRYGDLSSKIYMQHSRKNC